MVGLYRLCGSAAVKKELRDWFERNSSAVCLSEDLYPDINVITGLRRADCPATVVDFFPVYWLPILLHSYMAKVSTFCHIGLD